MCLCTSHVSIMCSCHVCVPIPYPWLHCMSAIPSHTRVPTTSPVCAHVPSVPPCPHHTPLSPCPACSCYVHIPITHLYPGCMSVPAVNPHDHVSPHIHVLAACPCPHPMSVCTPHAHVPFAHSRPYCMSMSLLHTQVSPCCMSVSPLHTRVPVAHPRLHHTPVTPWHLRAPTALSCPHQLHISVAPPLRRTPPQPSLPRDPPSPWRAAMAPGGPYRGWGLSHTYPH